MYFSKIGQETNQNVPPSDKSFAECLSDSVANSMFLDPIDSAFVINTISKLKTNTSSGHDQISTTLLNEPINNIAEPITHIINKSFKTGVVPNHMKIAKVVPI